MWAAYARSSSTAAPPYGGRATKFSRASRTPRRAAISTRCAPAGSPICDRRRYVGLDRTLRATGSPAHLTLRLRSTLLGFPVLPLRGLADYEAAAQLYRCCRLAGRTVRR